MSRAVGDGLGRSAWVKRDCLKDDSEIGPEYYPHAARFKDTVADPTTPRPHRAPKQDAASLVERIVPADVANTVERDLGVIQKVEMISADDPRATGVLRPAPES